jgi:hypothetical protein
MRIAVAVVVGLLVVGTGPLQAGIGFDAMPVGCKWSIRKYDLVETETYTGPATGPVDGGYRTEVRDEELQLLLRHNTYDADGRLVRSDWSGGDWELFRPHSCSGVEGTCLAQYTNSLGVDFMVGALAVPDGEGFSVKPGPKGNRSGVTFFRKGKFGLLVEVHGRFPSRLIRMENCGTGS